MVKLHNETTFYPGPSTTSEINQLRAFDAGVKIDSVFFMNEIVFFPCVLEAQWEQAIYNNIINYGIYKSYAWDFFTTPFHQYAKKARELTKQKEMTQLTFSIPYNLLEND